MLVAILNAGNLTELLPASNQTITVLRRHVSKKKQYRQDKQRWGRGPPEDYLLKTTTYSNLVVGGSIKLPFIYKSQQCTGGRILPPHARRGRRGGEYAMGEGAGEAQSLAFQN